MQTVGAIVYFFKNGAHVSFPEEWERGGGGLLLHLPFFDKYTPQPCAPPHLLRSISPSCSLSGFYFASP